MHTIKCRAKLSNICLDGQPTTKQFEGQDLPLSEDGTFDGDTIVCDPCFIVIMPYSPSGRALRPEIEEAIDQARYIRRGRPGN